MLSPPPFSPYDSSQASLTATLYSHVPAGTVNSAAKTPGELVGSDVGLPLSRRP